MCPFIPAAWGQQAQAGHMLQEKPGLSDQILPGSKEKEKCKEGMREEDSDGNFHPNCLREKYCESEEEINVQ